MSGAGPAQGMNRRSLARTASAIRPLDDGVVAVGPISVDRKNSGPGRLGMGRMNHGQLPATRIAPLTYSANELSGLQNRFLMGPDKASGQRRGGLALSAHKYIPDRTPREDAGTCRRPREYRSRSSS